MYKKIVIWLLLLVCIADFFLVNVDAKVINCLNCNQIAVQNAVNLSKDGDIIAIPAGSCSWSSAIMVDLSSGKALSIQGSGIGNTVISGGRFNITGANDKAWRITGMTVSGNSGIAVAGETKGWRIDNITFYRSSGHINGRVIWVQATGSSSAYTSGLIDSCTFFEPTAIQFHVRGNRSSGGNESWNRPLGLGKQDAIYIENCNFILKSYQPSYMTTDCEGANYVFRYNKVTNGYLGMHDAIVSGYRGCRKWEIYENNFINSDQNTYWGIALRSGTGVVFNNTWNGKPQAGAVAISLYRTYQKGGDPWEALCSSTSGKAILNTTSNYPQKCTSGTGCVDIDGSSIDPDGYPCRDQIGRGEGNPQGSAPALFWNNKFCEKYPCTPTAIAGVYKKSGGNYYAENRDYCIGGENMPSNCNGIAVKYKPLIYPHPLRQVVYDTGILKPERQKVPN